MEQQKKRLVYIDCLRGFSMIFVLYQHILTFSLDVPPSWFAEVVRSFRMPLFFFISGFVSYKAAFEWNISNFGKIQLKKLRGQLLPTIVMFSIFVALHGGHYTEWMFGREKTGYWFTLVSFEIFLTYCVINMFFSKVKNKNIIMLVLGIMAIGISCVWYYLGNYENEYKGRWFEFFSLAYYARYFIYFIAGIIVKSKIEVFHTWVENKYFNFVIFFLAFVLPIIFPDYNAVIIIFSRLWCIYTLFYTGRFFFERKDSFLSKGLSIIGTHTLEIYFLHYFLLFKLPLISQWLRTLLTDYCFKGHSAEWLMEILVVGLIAIFLCFVCVGIKKVISAFPVVSELCFGPEKKENKTNDTKELNR